VQFIASSSALVLMTQHGNIYQPLIQQRFVFDHDTEANMPQKTINGSARRQLAHGTTDEKRSSKVPRGHKYMHRKASRKTHSTNGVNIDILSHVLRKTLYEHVNGLYPTGWLN